MGRTLQEVISSLPEEERRQVETRTAELLQEIEGLRALRLYAEQSQKQLASVLKIKQPSVHKIERQTDLYLSTLRRFIEAAGGKLELRVEFPGQPPICLTGVGDLGSPGKTT